jgi:hypothetical protein
VQIWRGGVAMACSPASMRWVAIEEADLSIGCGSSSWFGREWRGEMLSFILFLEVHKLQGYLFRLTMKVANLFGDFGLKAN